MNKEEIKDKKRKLHEIRDQIKGLREIRKEAWSKCLILKNEYKGIKTAIKLSKCQVAQDFKPASDLPKTPDF